MVVVALAAGLAACSAIKLAYASFDEFAFWWLDGYVDFTDDQEPRVRDDLKRLHVWHRSEELPRIAALLKGIEDLAPNNVTPGQVCAFWPQLQGRIRAVAERAEPAAAAYVLEMGEAQLANLQRKYDKNNADYRRDLAAGDPGKVHRKRVEQFADRAETFYGDLTPAQHRLIEEHVAHSLYDPRRVGAERVRRQQDALQTLRRISGQKPPPAEARAQLRAYLERAQASPDPAYRQYQESMVDETCRLVARLHNSTSAAQRDHAVRRLRGWQRDLRDLAGL